MNMAKPGSLARPPGGLARPTRPPLHLQETCTLLSSPHMHLYAHALPPTSCSPSTPYIACVGGGTVAAQRRAERRRPGLEGRRREGDEGAPVALVF